MKNCSKKKPVCSAALQSDSMVVVEGWWLSALRIRTGKKYTKPPTNSSASSSVMVDVFTV